VEATVRRIAGLVCGPLTDRAVYSAAAQMCCLIRRFDFKDSTDFRGISPCTKGRRETEKKRSPKLTKAALLETYREGLPRATTSTRTQLAAAGWVGVEEED
jgi:hypothetical protein